MSDFSKEVKKHLLSIRDGDRSAFKPLYDLTYNHLKRFVWGYISNKMYVDDVVGETYERVFRYINSFDPKHDGYSWLCEIAKNLAYDCNSREKRAADANVPPNELIAENWADDLATKIDVSRALEKLSERDQNIFRMRIYKQKTYKEIAKEMGMSAPAIYMRWRKILKIMGKYSK